MGLRILGEEAPREEVQQVQVGADDLGDAPPLHLEDDLGAIGEGSSVNLRDRRRRQGQVLEGSEAFTPLVTQGRGELGLDVREGQGRDIVLQLLEGGNVVFGENIRPGGEHLPELHEGGTQLLDGRQQGLGSGLEAGLGLGNPG